MNVVMRRTSKPSRGPWLSGPTCIVVTTVCLIVFVFANYVWWFRGSCETKLIAAQQAALALQVDIEKLSKEREVWTSKNVEYDAVNSQLKEQVRQYEAKLQLAGGGGKQTSLADVFGSDGSALDKQVKAAGNGDGSSGSGSAAPGDKSGDKQPQKQPSNDNEPIAPVLKRTRRALMPYPINAEQKSYYAALTPGKQPASSNIEPAPKATKAARALLIICYNRPDYLRRTLQAVFDRLPSYNRPHIYISQDGDDAAVGNVIKQMKAAFGESHPDVPFNHLQHPGGVGGQSQKLRGKGGQPEPWAIGYYKLSQHFGWALDKLFVDAQHPKVIILEDDLEVSLDFFDYFSAMEPLLDSDDKLLAVSAWNDMGQSAFASDPRQVYRSDFFPGLGWMLTRHMWEELGPKWPEAFWDDWLREPPQRRARQFLRPEVSRTYTFGVDGVSRAQFFNEYLGNINLNDVHVHWISEDVTYLNKSQWDVDFTTAMQQATQLRDLSDFVSYTCNSGSDNAATNSLAGAIGTAGDDGAGASTAVVAAAATAANPDVKFSYESAMDYRRIAAAFRFIDDIKAGVPRTAYKGTVFIKHNGCRKFITPSIPLDVNNAMPH